MCFYLSLKQDGSEFKEQVSDEVSYVQHSDVGQGEFPLSNFYH